MFAANRPLPSFFVGTNPILGSNTGPLGLDDKFPDLLPENRALSIQLQGCVAMGGLRSNNDRFFDYEEVVRVGKLTDVSCLEKHPFMC